MKSNLRKNAKFYKVNIKKIIKNLKPFLKGTVGVFYPLKKEVDLFSFFKEKEIYLPAIENKDLIYRRFDGILRSGKFNTYEAVGKALEKELLSVLVIPCLAANTLGYRVGYGKGYYDRFLKDFKGVTIGICLEKNLTNLAFQEKHDVRLNIIITEKRVIRCTI